MATDDALYDDDDFILYDTWAKQNSIMLEVLRMLDDDDEEELKNKKSRNRSCRRLVDKLSKHWEVECRDMRFRMTRPTLLKTK